MTVQPSPPDLPTGGWRTFQWLWSSQALSVLGSVLSGFAINLYLVQTRFPLPAQKGELAAALSLTLLAWGLTTIFGAPLAGALADRWDRRRMMLTANALNAALMLLGIVMLTTLTPSIGLLVVFTAVEGALAAVHSAAFDTTYSTLVPRDQLPRANGMMQTLSSSAGLIGPGLGALVIGLPALARQGGGPAWLAAQADGVPLALALDAVTFAIAAAAVWRLHIPTPGRHDAGPGRPTLKRDMTYGWTFILARPALLNLLLTFTAFNFLTVGTSVLRPLLLSSTLADDLRGGAWTAGSALAALLTTASLGSLLGGVVISAWGGLRSRRTLGILLPMTVAGLAQAASGLTHSVLLTCAAVGVYGLMVPAIAAHSMTIWQSRVPPNVQGRVFSVRRVMSQFTSPLSTAAAGLAAAHLPTGAVLHWAGVAVAVVAAAQLLNPHIRTLDDPAPTAHAEATTG
ncbi:MFS transporter [Deinococcus sp.]|uniref:MFS transporter n=1 Tax=Deinococcus sp. TaxID=47478 RepID=UPI002869BAE2|nr:MFS transporter [Deinococcus sp.]